MRAFGIAEQMRDPRRQAMADVAIAGCWLWVPSLPDVLKTMTAARMTLKHEILHGATLPTASYADVVKLCRSYGERPPHAGTPIQPSRGARLAVQTKNNRWVECAGIELFLHGTPPPTGSTVNIKVRNVRPERVSVSVTADAVFVELPQNGRVALFNQLAPGALATLTLNRPPGRSNEAVRRAPTIGFVMPLRGRS